MMVPGCHPLSSEIEDTKSYSSTTTNTTKGRKRGHQQEKSTTTSIPMIQRKRIKNSNEASSP